MARYVLLTIGKLRLYLEGVENEKTQLEMEVIKLKSTLSEKKGTNPTRELKRGDYCGRTAAKAAQIGVLTIQRCCPTMSIKQRVPTQRL